MKKILFATGFGILAAKVLAGIHVIDVTNLNQTTITAMQNVNAVLKQVQQYSTQLQQYEDQLKNSLAPASYIWDQAQQTMGKLQEAQSKLEQYKNSLGSIDNFTSTYLSSSSYNSSCLARDHCTAAEKQEFENNEIIKNNIRKEANDAAFKTLESQQKTIQSDAFKLDKIKSQAQNSQGRMEALGAANQLSGAMADQLMKIRQMLISNYNAAMAKAASDQAKDAASAAYLKQSTGRRNSVFDK